jgi:hypothetical protein
MVDKTDMDERFAQLDREWRRKYEALNEAWQRQHRELGDKMHAVVGVVCDAIKISARDIETINKMGHAVQTGLARLCAIDAAAEAKRDPGAQLNWRHPT